MKQFLTFAGKVIVAYIATSFVVGAVSYQFLTKSLFEGPLLEAFYRTPADPELWNQALIWAFPVQIVRAFLYAAVLYPFYNTLTEWAYWKRFAAIAGLLVILSVLASDGGTLESLYMMRPEFTTPAVLMRTLPEPIVRGLILSAWIARWMVSKPQAREES